MPIDQKFNSFQLIMFSEEMFTVQFEDELDSSPFVEALRQLAGRLADLADYYEEEGTDSLLESD